MNNKDNLQNAFKKAFEEHQEPLFQAQWDRLENSLANKKQKRRIIPWIFISILVSVASLGAGYWYAQSKQNNKMNTELLSQNSKQNNLSTDTKELENKNTINKNKTIENNTEKNINQTQKAINTKSKNSSSKQQSKRETDANNNLNRTSNDLNNNLNSNSDGLIKNSNVNSNGSINHQNPNASNTQNQTIEFETLTLQRVGLRKLNIAFIFDEYEPLKTKPIVRSCIKNEKFALGLSTGYSRAFYGNPSFSNPNKTHLEAKSVFKEKNKNTSTFFAQMFADLSLSKRIKLSLNSGVQYWEIQTRENIKYYHTNIPFRDIDGSIISYINIGQDTAQVFENKSLNKTNVISIPFGLSYFKPINCKTELQIKGGIIFNQYISAKGVTFALDNTENVDFSNTINKKMTLGFITGLTYFKAIGNNVWLGAGLQYQQNKMNFKEQYNDVSSNLNTFSFSFNIKRKF